MAASLVDELARRYAEPQRRYHGSAHIAALARLYAEVAGGPGWAGALEVKLALLFHDAIYEPGRGDNEARSAALARARLAPCPVDVQRVVDMILATADHGAASPAALAQDLDLAHFLDADMAILAAPEPVYAAYLDDLRREYAAVPAELFAAGRRRWVEAQLRRERIFHSPWFRARYEAQARANLERELG